MIAVIYTVGTKNKLIVVSFVALYSICNLIGFPLLIEKIAKRVGKDYLIMGTGMIFFISQMFTALSAYIVGIIMNSKTKISTMWGLSVPIFVAFIGFFFSFRAGDLERMISRKTPQHFSVNLAVPSAD